MIKLLNSSGRIEGISYLDSSPVAIEIENGIISKYERIGKLTDNVDPLYISPGLIDIQVNGYKGVSFSLEGVDDSSSSNSGLSSEEIISVTKAMWTQGVTSYFPTLTTNSQDLLLRNISILKGAMNDPSLLGSIPGFHLEGPYISPVDGYRGAHPKEHVRNPEWKEFLELYNAADGKILVVTIAPESEGAVEFIKKCREKGIVVSLGHHNGTATDIKDAIDAGAGLSTHLGNGCAGVINRHHNPIWPQLADDRLMISIISDGFHLPPEMLQVFLKVKSPAKIIIVSDMTSYAGLPAGLYKIKTGETIEKTIEGNLRFSLGGLYGSATPLPQAIGHIMKVTGCSLADAIEMTVSNPARLHHLSDRGILEPGKRADIIMFTLDNLNMNIRKTIVRGNLVYEA